MSNLRDYYINLTETTANGGGLGGNSSGGGGSGVTTAEVQAAVAAREAAQQAVDAAQDAVAAAEELDDDAKSEAQDLLITANANLAAANEASILVLENAAHDGVAQDARLDALEAEGVTEAFNVTALTTTADIEVANWANTNNNRQRLMSNSFKITENVNDVDGVTLVTIPEGTTKTLYIIGRQHTGVGNTPGSSVNGLELTVLNTGGVLSATVGTSNHIPGDYTALAFSDLTTINATLNPSITGGQLAYLFTESTAPPESVATVTGSAVDNADPANPVVNEFDDTALTALAQSAKDTADANSERLDDAVITTTDQSIAGVKNFTDKIRSTHYEALDPSGSVGLEIIDQGFGFTRITRGSGATTANTSILLRDSGVTANKQFFSSLANQAADSGAVLIRKDWLEDYAAPRVSVDARLATLETQQPLNTQAIADQVTALGAEISDTNTDFTAAFAAQAVNNALALSNQTQIGVNAGATATVAGNLQTFITATEAAQLVQDGRLDAAEAILSSGAEGQVLQKNAAGDYTPVYPYGYESIEDHEPGQVTNDSLTELEVVRLAPANLVGGRYEIDFTGLWNHNTLADDIIMVFRHLGVGFLGSPIRVEPKDVAGSGLGGSNQRHPFTRRFRIDLAAGSSHTFTFSFRPSVDLQISAVEDVLATFKRIGD